jgi:adenosylcobyric acid synthase
MAKSIMIQGTASGVGKTILTLALCRIFKQDGYATAPFKSQNMTPNTVVLKTGEEIAISQVLQAEAAGIEPDGRMNPILLKPQNFGERKSNALDLVEQAYESLASQYEVIVIEGAGSPVELNLIRGRKDIVNMGVARLTKAPVLLVANIDRGGVFASLYGTMGLMNEEERAHIKGTIVNCFTGDIEHFKDGVAILEEITGVPVVGVVPSLSFSLPEEDSGGGMAYTPDQKLDSQFDLIADHVRRSLDMEQVYRILNEGM